MISIILEFIAGISIAAGLVTIGIGLSKNRSIKINVEKHETVTERTNNAPQTIDPKVEEDLNETLRKQQETGGGMDSVIAAVNKVMGVDTLGQEDK